MAVRDLRIAVDVGVEQIGEKVVLRLCTTPLQLLSEVLLKLDHFALGVEALVDGDVRADACDGCVAPTLEVGQPVVGDVERTGDNRHGQRHSECLDEVDRFATGSDGDHLADEPRRDLAHRGFEVVDDFGRECLADQAAESGVPGRVDSEHGADALVATL